MEKLGSGLVPVLGSRMETILFPAPITSPQIHLDKTWVSHRARHKKWWIVLAVNQSMLELLDRKFSIRTDLWRHLRVEK